MAGTPPGVDSENDAEKTGSNDHHIRLRAYWIWEREGRPDGRALDHWLRARWELEEAPEPDVERLERAPDSGKG